MHLTPRRLILAATAVAALLTGVLSTTDRADAFLHRVLKPIVQTISLSVKRGQTYEDLEARRDAEIEGVDQVAQATEWQIANGWLTDPDAVQRERDRYGELRDAITDRTEREKRITRASYNRAIGVVWQEAAVEAITQIPGLNPRAARAIQSMVRGESPLEAALAAVTDGGARPDEIDVLRAEWEEARDALRNIRLPEAQGLRDRIGLLLATTRDPLGTLADRSGFDAAAQEVREALDQFRAVADEWTVKGARIEMSRFQRDEEWQRLSAHIAQLEQSTAGKALVAGMARQTIDRVRAMADRYDLPLDENQLLSIAAGASALGVEALVEARANGGSFDLDFDPIIRTAINDWLARAGQEPLPDPLSGELTLPAAVRVGDPVEMGVEPTGGGTVRQRPDYEVEWFVEPIPVAVANGLSFTRRFQEPGEQRIRVVVTDTTTETTVEAVAPLEVLGPFGVSIGPLGLFGQSGDFFNPEPEAALNTVYAGEVVRYTALVDNASPEARPLVEWTFPDGATADVQMGLVPPALRQAGRRGWYVDRAIEEPGSYFVRVSAADPQTGATATAVMQVVVVEEPSDENSWHASGSCRVEGEGEGYDFRWRVRITEQEDGSYLGTVFFHDCPGNGRARYQGEAIPQGKGRWWIPEAELATGRGRLGLLAPAGPLSMSLTAGTPPSPNIVDEFGTR